MLVCMGLDSALGEQNKMMGSEERREGRRKGGDTERYLHMQRIANTISRIRLGLLQCSRLKVVCLPDCQLAWMCDFALAETHAIIPYLDMFVGTCRTRRTHGFGTKQQQQSEWAVEINRNDL